uniref:Putative transcription factor e2f1 n=1 Tax=Culex tarsalis TaxID=7177 RepID=A0A1Q3EZ23_CULTA
MEQHNKKTGEAYGLNGGGGGSGSGSASTNQMASYGSNSRKPSVGSDMSSEDYEEVKPDIKVSSHLLDHGYGFGVTPQYQQQQQQQQPSHQHHHNHRSGSSSGGSNSYNSSSQHSSSYHHHHSPAVAASPAASSSQHHHRHGKPTTPNRTGSQQQQHKSASGDPQITNYFKAVKRRPQSSLSPTPTKMAKHSAASSGGSATKAQPSSTCSTPTSSVSSSSSKKRYSEGTRYDTSLGLLTKKFIDLLKESADGVVDLNIASTKLNVQKRRIYDITNVLEGIGILEKKSKNNIQWKLGNSLCNIEKNDRIQRDRYLLEQKENLLDRMIVEMRSTTESDMQANKHAYVTCQDLNSIDLFKEQIIVLIKAPPEAKLVLPDVQQPREIFLKSEKGEIDVFLCPESSENSPNGSGFSHASYPGSLPGGSSAIGGGKGISRFGPDPLLEDIVPLLSPFSEKLFSPRNKLKGRLTKQYSTAQRNLNKTLFGETAGDVPAVKVEPEPSVLDSLAAAEQTAAPMSVLTQKELDLLENSSSSPTAKTSLDFYSSSTTSTATTTIKQERLDPSEQMDAVAAIAARLLPAECTSRNAASIGDETKLSPEMVAASRTTEQTLNSGAADGNSSSASSLKGLSAKSTPVNVRERNAMMAVFGNYSPFNLPYPEVPEMDAFLPLEPLDNDYNFSLDHTEGVFELFDFNF